MCQVVRVWGSLVTAFFELEVKSVVYGEFGTAAATRSLTPPPFPSLLPMEAHGSRRSTASLCSPQQLSLSVDAEISVYAWAVASARLSDLGFDFGSTPKPNS